MCIVIRVIVRLLCAKDMTVNDIHKEMLPMYSEHCLTRQAVHNKQNIFRGKYFLPVLRLTKQCALYAVRVFPTATTRVLHRSFQGLVKRWDKCLNLGGDHVEK
jgi:hypothetical protein